MHGTRKNAAQNYPQIACRAEFGTHDGAEDRSCSGNVEELDHVNLPCGHGNVIHAVGFCYGRGFTGRVRAEHAVYEGSVNEIAQDKGCDAKNKREHAFLHFYTTKLVFFFGKKRIFASLY